jgi:hypothetical protein
VKVTSSRGSAVMNLGCGSERPTSSNSPDPAALDSGPVTFQSLPVKLSRVASRITSPA